MRICVQVTIGINKSNEMQEDSRIHRFVVYTTVFLHFIRLVIYTQRG